MSNISISIDMMICFERSGGTLLNQCLGCLPNVVILSEINPLGGGWGERQEKSFTTIKQQAYYWYNIDLRNDDFAESILELAEVCKSLDKHLIIRDWPFINFMPYENNQYNPPHRFLTLEALQNRMQIIPFAFARDSIDVWISTGCPPAKDFFYHYVRYVNAIIEKGIPIFKYEDFCLNPESSLRKICAHMGVEYSDSYKNYSSFKNVHGDVQIVSGSRGIKQNKIDLLPRRQISENKIAEINECSEMVEANSLLGYPPFYDKHWKVTRLIIKAKKRIINGLYRH